MTPSIHIACSRCGEVNLPGKAPLIDVQKNGICYCAICGMAFIPEPKA